jgi:hypothetical protein
MSRQVTREAWLEGAVQVIRSAVSQQGVDVPPVKVSCSWPGGGSPVRRIGECWSRAASQAGINEVFISPRIADSVTVVAILAHELAHAVDDCVNGHKTGWVAIARQMGLTGKPTQMQPPAELAQAWTARVVARFGEFPHSTLDKSMSPVKPQKARMLKCACGSCGAIWRLTQSVIDMVEGNMSCPACHAWEGVEVAGS